MLIEKIIIIDYKQEEANSFDFKDGANIVCSESNTAGKSCLLKSIYYSLGLDLKKFPKDWDYENMIFKIYYNHNGNKGHISRLKDIFWIKGIDKKLSIKEYSSWFSNLLNIQMKLPLRQKEELSAVYASAPLSLFYIDQDTSWNALYKNTVNLNMYKSGSIPKNIFEYFFGISNDKIIELEGQAIEIKNQKSVLNNQSSILTELKDSFITQEEIATIFDENAVKKEIQEYLKLASKMSKSIKKHKSNIYEKRINLDALKLDLLELDTVLKNLSLTYKKIESKCTQCNSELTVEQSIKRMKLDKNRVSIQKYKIDLERKVEKLKVEVQEALNKKLNLENDYNKLLSVADVKQGELTLNQYIEEKAKENTKNIYCEIKNTLFVKESDLDEQLKDINKKIRELKKATKERKEEIQNKFNALLTSKKMLFPKADLKYEFLNFNSIKDVGSIRNQVFLSLYMTYTEIIFKYSTVKLPFVLDSIIKDELDDDVRKEFYSLVNASVLKTQHQTFFAMLNNKLKHIEGHENYNKIIIKEGRLLSKKKYLELKNEIPDMD